MSVSQRSVRFGAQTTAAEVIEGVDLHGRRAVVTGASSGIGVETARALAAAGAEVTLAVRDTDAGTRVAARLAAQLPPAAGALTVTRLDLADRSTVAAFSAGWSGPLHILVANAGVMALPQLSRTPDGWEVQFAVNHLGHFTLATGPHRALAAAGGARVVSVSSIGHLFSPVVFDDLDYRFRPYDPWSSYGQSKTANILFAVGAAGRWATDGITANALMPGNVGDTSLTATWTPNGWPASPRTPDWPCRRSRPSPKARRPRSCWPPHPPSRASPAATSKTAHQQPCSPNVPGRWPAWRPTPWIRTTPPGCGPYPNNSSASARVLTAMASHHQYWIRLRRQLWQPPRPHGEQPRGRVVGPLELFYDLIVVVLVAQAAHHLAAHLTGRGLGEFAAVFTLVWIAWLNGTLHHELHSRDDARGRSTFLLQILVLVPLGAFIPEAGGARGSAFATATGVLFALLAVLWFLAARGDQPEYRRPSHLFVTGTALCAAVLAASAFLPAGPRVLTWGLTGLVYLAGFTAVIATVTPVQAAALTMTDALIERFGLLIIIVLGETVMGVVDGLTYTPVNALTLLVALVAVLAGFGAWWTYFDFAGHRPPRPARPPTLVWMLTHLPLTAAIAAMGAAMISLTEHAHTTHTPTATAWGLSISTAIILGATALLTTSLQAWHHQPALYRPLSLTCIATSALCLGLSIARPTPLIFGLALVVLFGIPWAFAVAHRVTHPGSGAAAAARRPPQTTP